MSRSAAGEQHRASSRETDATTLNGKVLCGYQGWFRCPGDPDGRGWVHWSRDRNRIAPETLTFEMWPDLADYSPEEKYPAPGFIHPDGSQAYLYSAANRATVERHFDWMARYGIDGVFVQRFVVEVGDPVRSSRVLGYARDAARRTGRTFALTYDMSGMRKEQLYDRLVADWKYLVDEMKVTQDPRYLRHNGKPVLEVWGFFNDRFGADLGNRIVDFFKNDPRYGVTLVGGCEWPWRTVRDPEWGKVFRRFDVISPWNVGHTTRLENGERHAATTGWAEDLRDARQAGMKLMPVVYPGFSWDNLQRRPPGSTNIPRLGGRFLWKQFSAAASLGLDTVYVAMFDEVDEGTAIFKVSNTPPAQGHFVTYEGLPADWYLRLVGEGTRLIRRERPNSDELPIRP